MRISSVGHAFFAVTLIGLAILGLIKGDLTAIWQPIPKAMPAPAVLTYLCIFISLACGIGLLWQRTAALAARVLLAFLLLWMLLWRVPAVLLSFTVDFWWSASKTAVMTAGAWILYIWFAADWDKRRLGFVAGDNGLRIARVLYGLALIPFGIAHFMYLKQTTYWSRLAAIACVLGLLHRRRLHRGRRSHGHRCIAQLAATLSALETGLITLLVWVPMAVDWPPHSLSVG